MSRAVSRMTAIDVETALGGFVRSQRRSWWPQVRVRRPQGPLCLDGVALELRERGLRVHGYVIRMSRADLLLDDGCAAYVGYCDSLTVVCPAREIRVSDLSAGMGLLWCDPMSREFSLRRRAALCENADTGQVRDGLLRLLASGRAWRPPDRYGRYVTARDYVERRAELRRIGDELGTLMAERVQRLEREAADPRRREIESKARAWDEVASLLHRHGLALEHEGGLTAGQLARLEADLSAGDATRLMDDLERVRDMIDRTLNGIHGAATKATNGKGEPS